MRKRRLFIEKIALIFISIIFLIVLIFTAGLVDPAVQFADPGLEAAVRDKLEKPEKPIHKSDLLTITELDASARDISNLQGIEYLRQLVNLNLEDNVVEDLAPLGSLYKLTELNLRNNAITDLGTVNFEAITSLPLRKLSLRENDLSCIAPLANLEGLLYLNIRSNENIETIEPIAGLVNLQTLIMRNVQVGDQVTALRNLTNLQRLNIRNCAISETSVIGDLMAEGALQDNPETGEIATLNIRDNNLVFKDIDTYGPIREYWANITHRQPFSLPRAYSSISTPQFSHPGGFYEEDFLLELTVNDPDAVIYYTLDGSEPNHETLIYSEPIKIDILADEPNKLSLIPTSNSWVEPAGRVFKASVVRAIKVDQDGKKSSIISNTYFVDPLAEALYSLAVVSLTTDSAYLFDSEIGIYTIENATERGSKWERPAHIEFYEPNGKLGFAQNIGIRIHGGAGRKGSQKSLRLYARPEYDVQDVFAYEIFPGLTKPASDEPLIKFQTLILRNSGNDWNRTMFRDALMQSLVSDFDSIETQAYRPIILFINGEYWGIHNIRERYDLAYVVNNYNVSKDLVAIITRNSQLKEGLIEDRDHYQSLFSFIENADLKKSSNYQNIKTQMDIESYIDYYVTNIYLGNTDWPHNNIDYWRIRSNEYIMDEIYGHDGRWRWMLYDTDFGFGLNQDSDPGGDRQKHYDDFREKYGPVRGGPEGNTLMWALVPLNLRHLTKWPNVMFRSLLENEEFKNQFINRMADQLNSSFHPERVLKQINTMQTTLEPEMEEHIKRWRTMGDSISDWHNNIEVMRDFARRRPQFIRKYFMDHFGLSNTANITLSTDTSKGFIKINSIIINSDTPGIIEPNYWTGKYFKNVPINITALPNIGYTFTSWKEIDENNDSIILTLTEDIVLTAIFSEN